MTEIQKYLAEEVAEDLADGIITRREAMRRLGLLGVSGAAASALLAAGAAPAIAHGKRHRRHSTETSWAPVARESIRVRDLVTLTHGLAGSGPVVLRTAYTGPFTTEQLLDLQERIKNMYVDELIEDYIVSLVTATRHHERSSPGRRR